MCLLYPDPKEAVLPSAACDCWFLSLCCPFMCGTALMWLQSTPEWSSGGVQCGAHTFITSCECTEILGDLKPLGQHTFIDRVCVLGTAAGAWECFNLLSVRGFLCTISKFLHPATLCWVCKFLCKPRERDNACGFPSSMHYGLS